MYNVKFAELDTTYEFENDDLFDQVEQSLDLGAKQRQDLRDNFTPIISIPIYLHFNFETGEILGFETESYRDDPNCVKLTLEDWNKLKGGA